jgi:hypothetical protein
MNINNESFTKLSILVLENIFKKNEFELIYWNDDNSKVLIVIEIKSNEDVIIIIIIEMYNERKLLFLFIKIVPGK